MIACNLIACGVLLLSGHVRAAEGGEPVPYASVELVELDRRVDADVYGYFVFADVPSGRWTIRASGLGYVPATFVVAMGEQAASVELRLEQEPLELPPVAVTVGRSAPPGTQMHRVGAESIRQLPGLAEPDVLRALSDLPPVATASDFSGALYVRGGTPDQVLFRLDGALVFNPYHLAGVFSAIDPEAVASVDLLTGAMPASAGDRLSGVIDVFTRDGGNDRIRAHAALGLVSSRIGVDGPLPGSGTFLFSGRRTYLDALTGAVREVGIANTDFPYAFHDVHAKVTYRLGSAGRLSLSTYLDGEHFGTPAGFDIPGNLEARWGTGAASTSFRYPLLSSMVAEVRLGYSRFSGNFRYGDTSVSGSDALDAILGMSWIGASGGGKLHLRNGQIHFGVDLERYGFEYDIRSQGGTMPRFFPGIDFSRSMGTAAGFVEGEVRLSTFDVRAGLRIFDAGSGRPVLLPRAGIAWSATNIFEVHLGGGRYAQALAPLRDEESTLSRLFAYDLLIPIDSTSATAYDIVAGVRLHTATLDATAQVFRKWQKHLLLPPLPEDPDETPLLVVESRGRGSANAAGLELMFQYGTGRTRFAASYVLSDFERALDGMDFTPGYERSHRLRLTGGHDLGRRHHVSLRAVWESGLPYTPADGFYRAFRFDPATGRWQRRDDLTVAAEFNSERLPVYHRLDLGYRFTSTPVVFGKPTTLALRFDIFNAFNTRNVLRGSPRIGETGPRLEYAPQLPLLPTVGVEWRF